jgi:serine phosphatase RsbU (regulator of sigma subunit)/integral membrane sensor domain MASE1
MVLNARRALFFAVLIGYAAGSQLAFMWFGADGTNASFFPAAGVTFAALALSDRRLWPTVLAAAGLAEFTIDLLHGISTAASLGYVVANLLQPLVGVSVLRRLHDRVDIARTADLLRYIACGLLLAPFVGGVVGATNFVLVDGGSGWARFAADWWVGDGLGILVVGSAILAWAATAAPIPAGRWESTVLVAGTMFATALVFWTQVFGLASLPVALLMATAARVRTRGVALAGAASSFIAATLIAGGHRFWENTDLPDAAGMLYLQLTVATALTTALVLAAEMNAREAEGVAAAGIEAARLEQQIVAADDALLAQISLALDSVTTVEDRLRRLGELLREHRSIELEVTIRGERELEYSTGPDDFTLPPSGDPNPEPLVRALHARGRTVGELRLFGAHGDRPDLRGALVDGLAVRVGLALENARLYERERDASHALQSGLLGDPAPEIDGCELGTCYRPATSSLEVGGDWHDAVPLPNGHVLLAVGDVVGHGLDAAITMGQLRSAVRSLAPLSSPAELLTHLDDFVLSAPNALASTLCLVDFDPLSGQIVYACAGHPPPLAVEPGRKARYLWGGRSTPLGWSLAARKEASGVLVDGATLLLYTDGSQPGSPAPHGERLR